MNEDSCSFASYIMMIVPAPSSLVAMLMALEVNTAANNCCLKLALRLVAKGMP
jgi:hypothetical protein